MKQKYMWAQAVREQQCSGCPAEIMGLGSTSCLCPVLKGSASPSGQGAHLSLPPPGGEFLHAAPHIGT